jgi:aryl-alcohol dehydrogenase-like predicted oxidoreductase/predicted kinase
MRLSTDEDRDEQRGFETIAAAAGAGITVFDTARSYGDNERLLASALRRAAAADRARIVTKGGMARAGAAWVPDGRAKTLRRDCEASLEALDGLPVDLYLIHAPDPRTPWRTSLRALARLADEGLVRRVGVSNVNRPQLEEALELAPVAAVQVALSVLDDRALRGGLVELCAERGIGLIAHSPLGGPRRAGGLARRGMPAEVALAWLLALSPVVVAIPGARRPETARSAARAASLQLDAAQLASLGARGRPRVRAAPVEGEVVVVMGIPGAGKGRVAAEYVDRGYARLNRDERGGSLKELAAALEAELASGARRVVLDNTYLTRASRSYVLDAAGAHGLGARCLWVDTPLAQAQVNLVERLLDRFGSLPAPEELRGRARTEAGLLLPTSQMRALRELEPPALEEGWASVEQVPFVRLPRPGATRAGVFVAAGALSRPGWEEVFAAADPTAPLLLFDWRPDGDEDGVAELAARIARRVEAAVCPHPGGPPACWCRPPLPGLPLAFARTHGIDPARSVLVGTGPAHRALAAAIGAGFTLV